MPSLCIRILHAAACLVLTAGSAAVPASAQEPAPRLSPAARAYLTVALDTLEATVLGRDTIPWRIIRDSAMQIASGARTPAETHGAIAWALRRINKHSFLQANAPGAVSEIVRGTIGYLHVPQRGGGAQALADSLHTAVATLERAGVCGWIVDLRGNGGGNMWPMLAGIGPLLGDSIVGAFGPGPSAERWYYRRGVAGILSGSRLDTASSVTVPVAELRRADAPIAVLIDGSTGSSGEAVAIAFRGRPDTRSFGAPTAGFATANRGSRLPDGANMVLTSGYYTDRRGVQYPEQLQPDVRIDGPATEYPFATDRVATMAADWVAAQPGCRASSR